MKTQKIEEAIEKVIGSLDLKGITQEEMFGKEGIIKTLTAKLINKERIHRKEIIAEIVGMDI